MKEATGGLDLTVNGHPVTVAPGTTVASFLEAREIIPGSVVVELNGTALGREDWPARRLAPGDSLEIIRFMGGG